MLKKAFLKLTAKNKVHHLLHFKQKLFQIINLCLAEKVNAAYFWKSHICIVCLDLNPVSL